jgi:purine-binding chemotaxis protein CheW
MSESSDNVEVRQYLEFRIGAQHYAAEILSVREVRMIDAITPMAQAPVHIAGVMNLRGNIVPVVDLGVRFNVRSMPLPLDHDPQNPAIALLAELGEELIALRVDRILDVLSAPATDLQPVPKSIASLDDSSVTALLHLEDRLLLVLDLQLLATSLDVLNPVSDTINRSEALAVS